MGGKGCGCKEVYRLSHITFLLYLFFFAAASLLLFFLKMFFKLWVP